MRLTVSTEAERYEAKLRLERARGLIQSSKWIQEPETTNLCQFFIDIESGMIIEQGDENEDCSAGT